MTATGTLTLALMPGDGIGPEISRATRAVLEAAAARFGFALAFEEVAIGFAALEREGTTFPAKALEAARAADGIVLGPVSHNDYPAREAGGLNPSGELRKRLDLYANIRPARTRPGIAAPTGAAFDLVIYRENTEGFYADRNMAEGIGDLLVTEDVAVSLRRVTRAASERIARAAFAAAAARRGRVTAVHKANVLRRSDGLFLAAVRGVAAEFPDVELDEVIIDAMCAHLVRAPERFDVICTTNMYGDILSDLASELSGSLGLAASLNAGEATAMAQAQHGSAPDIAGQGVANPSSLIGSAAMLLDWLGQRRGEAALVEAGAAIGAALDIVNADPGRRCRDLGGTAGTDAFAAHVCAALG